MSVYWFGRAIALALVELSADQGTGNRQEQGAAQRRCYGSPGATGIRVFGQPANGQPEEEAADSANPATDQRSFLPIGRLDVSDAIPSFCQTGWVEWSPRRGAEEHGGRRIGRASLCHSRCGVVSQAEYQEKHQAHEIRPG